MAATEQVFPATPPLIGGGRVLPTPAAFYVTGEDRLRIVSANSLSGVVLKVHAHIATPRGETIPQAWTHRPASDRTTVITEEDLGVGSLLNLTVFAAAGAPLVGQTFVIAQLVRGVGAAAIVLGTLLQGYVTGTQSLAWPGSPIQTSIEGGGFIREVVGTNPAAGVESAEIVPTGARWELLVYTIALTASAVVAARTPALGYWSPNGHTFLSTATVALNASEARSYYWSQGMPIATFLAGGPALAGLTTNVTLPAGTQILTSTSNLDSGDNYSAPVYRVREWLEVP